MANSVAPDQILHSVPILRDIYVIRRLEFWLYVQCICIYAVWSNLLLFYTHIILTQWYLYIVNRVAGWINSVGDLHLDLKLKIGPLVYAESKNQTPVIIQCSFLQSFSPFHWFKKGSCQFLVKECAQILVNPAQEKCGWVNWQMPHDPNMSCLADDSHEMSCLILSEK